MPPDARPTSGCWPSLAGAARRGAGRAHGPARRRGPRLLRRQRARRGRPLGIRRGPRVGAPRSRARDGAGPARGAAARLRAGPRATGREEERRNDDTTDAPLSRCRRWPPSPSAAAVFPVERRLIGRIERADPRLDRLVPPGRGHRGPGRGLPLVRGARSGTGPTARLLFSDVPQQRRARLEREGRARRLPEAERLHRPRGRRAGASRGRTASPSTRRAGSSCASTATGASRGSRTGASSPLVERFEGKRFNSPNDLVFGRRRRHLLHRPALRPHEDVRGPRARDRLERRLPRWRPTAA